MSNASKYRKKAVEYEQLKQFDRAVASYVRAIEENENASEEVDVALFNKVGDLTLRQGRVTEAVTYYERAVEHYVNNSLYDNAIALCNKILRNAPGRSNVYFTLGRICGRKGLRADATRNFLEYATRMQQDGRVEEGMRALAEVADLMPELTEVRRLVEEYAERAGISLASRKRNTPPRNAAQNAPEPSKLFGMSRDLVFLDIDYDAAKMARGKTPPPQRSVTGDMAAVRRGTGSAAAIKTATGSQPAVANKASAPVAPPLPQSSRLEDLMIFDPRSEVNIADDIDSEAIVVDGSSIIKPYVELTAPVDALPDLEPTNAASGNEGIATTADDVFAPLANVELEERGVEMGASVEAVVDNADVVADGLLSNEIVAETATEDDVTAIVDAHEAAPIELDSAVAESEQFIDSVDAPEPIGVEETIAVPEFVTESAEQIDAVDVDGVLADSAEVVVADEAAVTEEAVSVFDATSAEVPVDESVAEPFVVEESIVDEELSVATELDIEVPFLTIEQDFEQAPPTAPLEDFAADEEPPVPSDVVVEPLAIIAEDTSAETVVSDDESAGVATVIDAVTLDDVVVEASAFETIDESIEESVDEAAVVVSGDTVEALIVLDDSVAATDDNVELLPALDFDAMLDMTQPRLRAIEPDSVEMSIVEPPFVEPPFVEPSFVEPQYPESEPEEILLLEDEFESVDELPPLIFPLTDDVSDSDAGVPELELMDVDASASALPDLEMLDIAPATASDAAPALDFIDLGETVDEAESTFDAIELDAVELDTIALEPVELDAAGLDAIEIDAVELESIELDSIELDSVELETVEIDTGEVARADSDIVFLDVAHESADEIEHDEAHVELYNESRSVADEQAHEETNDAVAATPQELLHDEVEYEQLDDTDDLGDLFGDADIPTALVAAEATIVASSRCTELRAASDEDPGNFTLRRRLAEALLEAGNREEALGEFGGALAGAEIAGAVSDAADMADELVRVAGDDIAHHQKRLELSIRLGEQSRLRDAYLDLADLLVRRGEDLRAKAVYARVLEIDPWDDRARTALGDAAPPPPSRPAEPSPDDEHVNLADWLRDDDEPASTRLRMREPDISGDEQDDFNALLKHFKEGVARSLGEDDYESHYDLGVAYKEMGLLEDAIGEFQMALRSRNNRLAAYEALGQCFIEQGSHKVAVTVLSRALHEPGVRDEQRIGVLYLLGISCEVLQRFDESRGYFQRVYATDIHFRDVAQRLADLERTVR
jgi:tetratricopeptide (TPR) repeat protein